MSAPSTQKEINGAIRHWWGTHWSDSDTPSCLLTLAHDVWKWREEWVRDAEPRLRPVSEKPNTGDFITQALPRGFWTAVAPWGSCQVFTEEAFGWYLIKRAPAKTLAEEARQLTECPIPVEGDVSLGPWTIEAWRLLRRVAEQGDGK